MPYASHFLKDCIESNRQLLAERPKGSPSACSAWESLSKHNETMGMALKCFDEAFLELSNPSIEDSMARNDFIEIQRRSRSMSDQALLGTYIAMNRIYDDESAESTAWSEKLRVSWKKTMVEALSFMKETAMFLNHCAKSQHNDHQDGYFMALESMRDSALMLKECQNVPEYYTAPFVHRLQSDNPPQNQNDATIFAGEAPTMEDVQSTMIQENHP